MGTFSKLTAVFAVCAGLFLQVGDKTVPVPVPAGQQITHDSSDAAALAALETHLAERGKVLDEVLVSLQSMHEMRTLDADRLNDLAEVVSEWATEKEVKLVALDATVKMAGDRTQTLEERVTELEALVKELQKTCASCNCASTVGQQAPAPTVGAYGPAVGAVGYGSTGSRPVASSVSYGCTGTSYSVGYGSNGTSFSYQMPTSYSYNTQWAPPPPTYTETVTTTSAPAGGTCYTDAAGNCTNGPTTQAAAPVARQGILKRIFGR